MQLAVGAAVSFIPALPGWTVRITSSQGARVCTLAGWAIVVDEVLPDTTALTKVAPLFIHGSELWTIDDFRAGVWADAALSVIAPGS
jgi:hypothetical protein